jgi:hypothetical protein
VLQSCAVRFFGIIKKFPGGRRGREREGERRGKRGRETMRREREEEGVEEREGGSTAKKLKIIRKKIGVKKEKD